MLRGEQSLQREGLFDGEAGELVAGLGGFERTDGVAGSRHGVAEQARVRFDAIDDLALQEGGALEAGVFLLPSCLGIAHHVVGGERGRDLCWKEAFVGALRFLEFQCDALAGTELGLDVGQGALKIGR